MNRGPSRKGESEIVKQYLVVAARQTAEIEAIKAVRPPRILVSYFYFRNRSLADFITEIGYRPEEIILDSGAYSAFTQGRNISLIDYMEYIRQNRPYIYRFMTLDVIGNPRISRRYYQIMQEEGFEPVPVFHYGSDFSYLDWYAAQGNDFIALGGCVPVPDKTAVAEWVNECIKRWPGIKFHVLGTNHRQILSACPGLESVDATTWIMAAANGYPKTIPGRDRAAKIERAKANIVALLERGVVQWGLD